MKLLVGEGDLLDQDVEVIVNCLGVLYALLSRPAVPREIERQFRPA
jgi:hypothetical protein